MVPVRFSTLCKAVCQPLIPTVYSAKHLLLLLIVPDNIGFGLVALGLDLDLSVIAEGVETEKQRELLEKQGCMLYQGYLFGPALTRSRFEAFVAASSTRAVGESIPN